MVRPCAEKCCKRGRGRPVPVPAWGRKQAGFPDESFNAVVSNYVCHNITGADKRALLLETLRVLKKGGVVARIILPPAPEVSVNIRKGVAVDDAPSTIAG